MPCTRTASRRLLRTSSSSPPAFSQAWAPFATVRATTSAVAAASVTSYTRNTPSVLPTSSSTGTAPSPPPPPLSPPPTPLSPLPSTWGGTAHRASERAGPCSEGSSQIWKNSDSPGARESPGVRGGSRSSSRTFPSEAPAATRKLLPASDSASSLHKISAFRQKDLRGALAISEGAVLRCCLMITITIKITITTRNTNMITITNSRHNIA
mmetsp:Transcript_25228/g.58369  ORF Transcript_25228/g.58369 Transcript_25228/m.58369 type:complete len:210 (-) Transcript_25228:114-743(-)